MKKAVLALCSLLCIATSAYAGLPKEFSHLENRKGVLVTTFSGKVYENESNLECSITQSTYDDGTDSVMIDAPTYFAAIVYLEDAKKEVKGDSVVYKTTSTGKGVGSTVCGDIAPLLSFKETVTVTKNSVSIRQKYICAPFERVDYDRTCTLK